MRFAICAAVACLMVQSGALAQLAAQKDDGQPDPVTTAIFHFENRALTPPQWSIHLTDDHAGVYIVGDEEDSASPHVDITFNTSTWDRVIAGVSSVKAQTCETKAKNIAKTGAKKLSFKLAVHEWVSCAFNYSDDAALMSTTDTFLAMAETMQAGERLKFKHRFDRLGLDAEITSFQEQVKAGRAIEVQNIAPVLRSIAEDEKVIDRVRRTAARLLDAAQPPESKTMQEGAR